jgi:hypothetical protein
MKLMRITLGVMLAVFAISAHAQKIKLTEGSLDDLKGVTSMKVQYDYSDLKVGKKAESDYLSEKKEAYNKKESGKGDKWESAWKADRQNRFQGQFEEKFKEFSDIELDKKGSSTYMLILKTTMVEPGYNVYVKKGNAKVDSEAWIVETGNP